MFNLKNVKAHCDIPCGIYDPITAQIAALSVIRMIDLIHANKELKSSDELMFYNNMARYVAIKESEAIKCKDEIRIIWGDFIKPQHLEQFPEIHTIVHNIMAKGSAAKQQISREKALDLLNEVNRFAEIFWKIKGIKTKTVKSPYAPNESVVYPIL